VMRISLAVFRAESSFDIVSNNPTKKAQPGGAKRSAVEYDGY
jgi:hypothetical protein